MKSILFLIVFAVFVNALTEEDEGVKYASRCEVCKILATELELRLKETGKSKEVLETGYSLDDVKPKKRIDYHRSELRLEESKEGVCDRILEYNLHKERADSTRFAKGMSQTFRTLHGLVDKGVNVDLGIPYELWDKPSVEITNLKSQCENMLENYEEVIEKWYLEGGDNDGTTLPDYLCRQHILPKDQAGCLREKGETGVPQEQTATETKRKKQPKERKKDSAAKANKQPTGERKEEL